MKIITKLNKSKSPGYDNIGPSLIKDFKIVILDALVSKSASAAVGIRR